MPCFIETCVKTRVETLLQGFNHFQLAERALAWPAEEAIDAPKLGTSKLSRLVPSQNIREPVIVEMGDRRNGRMSIGLGNSREFI